MADAVDTLLQLADAAREAKQVVADATAKMNAAKMAQIGANEQKAANEQRWEQLIQKEADLVALRHVLEADRATVESGKAALQTTFAALAAREKEIGANEQRVLNALAAASQAETNGKSYEGAAYARLQAVRATLREAETL